MDKYFDKYGKPKYAFKMIHSELKDAAWTLKKGKMPSGDISSIKNANDSDFITLYEDQIDVTFPNELAEAVIKIVDLADSYGFNLADYIDVVNRYCMLKNSQSSTTSTSPLNKVVVRYL